MSYDSEEGGPTGPPPPLTGADLDRLMAHVNEPIDPFTLMRLIAVARQTIEHEKYLSEHDIVVQLLGRKEETSALQVALRLEMERDDAIKRGTKDLQSGPFALRFEDGSYVAFYPKMILDNGWEPYNQPDPRAYIPYSFSQCIRYDLGDSALLIYNSGRTIPSPPPLLEDEENRLP